MTTTAQHTTWLRFHVFQAKIEKKYTPVLKREINKQIDVFNAHAKVVGYDRAASQIFDYFDPVPVMNIVNDVHAESAGKYGASVYNEFKGLKAANRITGRLAITNGSMAVKALPHAETFHVKRVSLFGVSDTIAKQILNELRLSLLNNVHGIEDSIKKEILYYIKLGQENGWSYDETAKAISAKVGSTYRAQRIVRTESVKASNMGAMAGAEMTGLLMDKVWINARDKRVRGNPTGKVTEFDHWDIGGTTLPMQQSFFLGSRNGPSEYLRFPGDPNGSPANIIKCRCTLGFIPKRDANGLPIRVRPRMASAN